MALLTYSADLRSSQSIRLTYGTIKAYMTGERHHGPTGWPCVNRARDDVCLTIRNAPDSASCGGLPKGGLIGSLRYVLGVCFRAGPRGAERRASLRAPGRIIYVNAFAPHIIFVGVRWASMK